MDYEKLIETVSTIVEDEKIYKVGLTLTYELNKKNHKQFNEELFSKSKSEGKLEYSDEYLVEIGGITIKFVKPKEVEE